MGIWCKAKLQALQIGVAHREEPNFRTCESLRKDMLSTGAMAECNTGNLKIDFKGVQESKHPKNNALGMIPLRR